MYLIAQLLTLLVAALHAWFLILEMFLWDKPLGMKTFRLTAEYAQASKTLAANQGLYNGFLAAGLIWGVLQGACEIDVQLFFLGCVIIAGLYGAYSVSRRIFYVQAMPALCAVAALMLA